MADEIKIGIDDIVASATTGVLRAFEARKIRAEGIHFNDVVQSGFNVDFWIRAGGPFYRHGGPLGGPGGGPLTGGGPLGGGGIG